MLYYSCVAHGTLDLFGGAANCETRRGKDRKTVHDRIEINPKIIPGNP
jgi:hypothetical protein